MATQADVRRIALALPGAIEGEDRFAFSVRTGKKDKGFAWVSLERIHPKQGACRRGLPRSTARSLHRAALPLRRADPAAHVRVPSAR